ncbi:MAG: hypothetical protein Q7S40_13245 [Opitutaceae bacterium]|nr:hypothetical protein [Opitutaceae bacterium]
MIGASLSTFILAGVLSTFLFLGRSGANMRNYNDMEAQARKALELFAEDTRQASSVSWASSSSLTLTVNSIIITYTYDSTAGTFSRAVTTGTPTTLLTGITQFNFLAYTISGTSISDFSTAAARTIANNTTKQVQISLSAARTSTTVTSATNIVLSARYVLRNKRVTA